MKDVLDVKVLEIGVRWCEEVCRCMKNCVVVEAETLRA